MKVTQLVNMKYLGQIVGLAALGLVGNYLSFSLYFSVALIFGSIFVMVALANCGRVAAAIVALVAGSYT